ncbi:Putative cysteine protease YraA [Paraconexibacter sp. AEG42_29]|uniref:Cysteine protease YraA n=1 Tax=Paraconexibacter sp. AEG42_29 TaxID=2997339 RepID=A0AAU7AUH1_9ACTN
MSPRESDTTATGPLTGRRVAVIATDGVEQVELTGPLGALVDAGARVDLLALESGEIQAFDHLDPGDTFTVDATVAGSDVTDYDAIVLPGGVANPDALRMDEDVVAFVRAHAERGGPIAAICHAPWLLVEAGLARGRTLTSWPSLRTDLANAGATWVDEETVVDRGVLTSRNPDDVPAFGREAVKLFAAGDTHDHRLKENVGAID